VALTSAQKQKALRERKSHGGLFRIREFWCHPDDEPQLRALEKELREKRLSQMPNAVLKRAE